jgi:signal transduction histidine kinase
MRLSLRLKVALALFAACVLLLAMQAIGVRVLAEGQEESLINAIIEDDMRNLLQSWRDEPATLPPLDPKVGARVSAEGGAWFTLPPSLATLPEGVHEVMMDGHEVHLAVTHFGSERVVRAYDYSVYERHFKNGMNMLMFATALFALPTVWLAYWLSGLLVRQVGSLARQVKDLRSGAASAIDPASYDEREVAGLAEAVNDYHRRMAAMVEREKEFTANVSHELRTPLTRIRTSCELLEPVAGALDAKSRRRLLQIEQAAEDMHALVECLLALARDETGTVGPPVRLAELVGAIVERYAERLEKQAVRIVVDVAADACIHANAPALGIVLSNLVDNALRHTEDGEIRVTYRDGTLSVDDTGSGIAADALPHVFERFYRAPGGRGDGFGIGLAIVKKICERCGWQIEVHSAEGVGTHVLLGLKGP